MAITTQTNSTLIIYTSDGKGAIVFTDNGQFIQAVAAADGISIEFDKSDVAISVRGDFLTISDDTHRLNFRYSEGGYATPAAALVALVAMKQNEPAPPAPAGSTTVNIDQSAPGTSNFVQNKEMPDATATFATTPYESAAPEASAIVKAIAGVLYGFVYVNQSAGTRYVMVANSAVLPADGTPAPPLTFPVLSGGVLPFDTGKFGNFFNNGIVIWHSTTQFIKTLAGADATFYVQKA